MLYLWSRYWQARVLLLLVLKSALLGLSLGREHRVSGSSARLGTWRCSSHPEAVSGKPASKGSPAVSGSPGLDSATSVRVWASLIRTHA